MKPIILPFLLLTLTLSTCTGGMAPATATVPATVPPTLTPIPPTHTPIPPTPTPAWIVYSDPKYGYSLEYPDSLQVTTVNDEYVEIGDKFVIQVWEVDPTSLRGDGPVVESKTDTQLSGQPAKLLTGYIGAIGGYVPQQYKRIQIERNGLFFTFTVYALGLHATSSNLSDIRPLQSEDASLFDTILNTLKFPS